VLGANKKFGVKNNVPYVKLIPDGATMHMQSDSSLSISTNGGSTPTLNIHVYSKDSLVNTIIYNMVSEQSVKESMWADGFGKPIWEYKVWNNYSKFQKASVTLTKTFLGRLVPIIKFIWIDPENQDEMIYSGSEGISYRGELKILKEAGKGDKSYYIPPQNKKGEALLGTYRDSSHLWKEFSSLNVVNDRPLSLEKFKKVKNSKEIIQAVASSMLCKASMGLVYCEAPVTSLVNWKGDIFSDYLSNNIESIGKYAPHVDTTVSSLCSALFIFNNEMGCGPDSERRESNKNNVLNYFWSKVNGGFQKYFDEANNPTILEDWKVFINSTAIGALRTLRDNNMRCNISLVKAENFFQYKQLTGGTND
jgi:hypothetical protein